MTTGAAVLAASALGAAEASAASPVALGLHNAKATATYYERPGALFLGSLLATDLFDVTRVSPSGRWAQGYVRGSRDRTVWIAATALSSGAAKAPRDMTEVAGPAGTRVFRPAAALGCRGTNYVTVGVRGARRARVSVLRGGEVVARSRPLTGPGLAVDEVRVPCDGRAIVRYTVAGRSRDFRVTVDAGRLG